MARKTFIWFAFLALVTVLFLVAFFHCIIKPAADAQAPSATATARQTPEPVPTSFWATATARAGPTATSEVSPIEPRTRGEWRVWLPVVMAGEEE